MSLECSKRHKRLSCIVLQVPNQISAGAGERIVFYKIASCKQNRQGQAAKLGDLSVYLVV